MKEIYEWAAASISKKAKVSSDMIPEIEISKKLLFRFTTWLLIFLLYVIALFAVTHVWEQSISVLGKNIAELAKIASWGIWIYFFSENVLNPMRKLIDGIFSKSSQNS